MIYTLNIPDIHRDGVVAILQSLQQMGLIAHIEPAPSSYALDGPAPSADELLLQLEAAEAAIRAGKGYTTARLRGQLSA